MGEKMTFLKSVLCFSCLGLILSAQAQFAQDTEACEPLIAAAEQESSPEVYEECGFNDVQTAFVFWAPLAEQSKWKNALFELYRRHPAYPGIKAYLYKAAEFGHPSALVLVGDELFDAGKIPEAMRYYNAAIRGDLTEEEQGKITGRLAMLYADPKSTHYDTQKAVPLLKKAALQRQPLPNNVLGAFALFGMNNVQQNPEEAFKYFWRAILLGCPAAEENIGLFQLARQKKIDIPTLNTEIMKRAYSCEKVDSPGINSYHLTFSQKECSDINYYAEHLVDTSLPFTGKVECSFSADMTEMADFLSQ